VQGQVDLLNLAIKNQYTYERWQNVVSYLLAKEPGIPRCNKLRVIHLYEADLNALIGIKWRQLIHHVTDPLTNAINGRCPTMNIQPAFGASETQSLEYLQPSMARHTLCCYKCPSGNFKTGLQTIRKNVLNSHLDVRATHTYYFAVLLPSLSYSLPVLV
jgi:hypothetical protein